MKNQFPKTPTCLAIPHRLGKLLLAAWLVCGTFSLHAQTTWTGATNADWNTPTNWSAGIPDATDDVVVPNVTPAPEISTSAVAKSVTVAIDASLSISSAGQLTINGSNTVALLNAGGTIVNNGQLVIGNSPSAIIDHYGIENRGVFQNQSGASITINRSTVGGIHNQAGTFTNSGSIILGEMAAVGQYGIFNVGNFTNQAGGIIHVDNTSQTALYNLSTFANSGSVIIGEMAAVGENGIINTGNFTNQAGGIIHVDNTSKLALNSLSTFGNSGNIILGGMAAIGENGISNSGNFTNQAGGRIHVDNTSKIALNNYTNFDNSGSVILGEMAAVGQYGIINSGNFTNQAEGIIQVDNTSKIALESYTTFDNSGSVIIGKFADVGTTGIQNNGNFTNQAGGFVQIDRTSKEALFSYSTFNNSGSVIIGKFADVGEKGINNNGYFTNKTGGIVQIGRASQEALFNRPGFINEACATLTVYGYIVNDGPFTNWGFLRVDTDQPHTNNFTGRFINNGAIGYSQGNPIPNVTNNDLITLPISFCSGSTVSPALQLGGGNDFTAGAIWYKDAELTQVAGTYDQQTNTYTDGGAAAGTHQLYVLVTDADNSCSGTLALQVTVTASPTATVSGGGTVCAGQTLPNVSIALTGTAPFTFTYTNGTTPTTVTATSTNPYVITNPSSGTYTLTALSDAQCTGTSLTGSATVAVNALPTATIVGNSGAICSGANASFTVSGTSGSSLIYTLTGQTGNQTLALDGTNQTILANGATNNVTLTLVSVAKANCPASLSATSTVTVNPLPTSTLSGGGTACAGQSLPNVSIALTGMGPFNFTYTNGTTPTTVTGISTNPYVIASAPAGTYTLTALSDAHCTGTSFTGSATVTVRPAITLNTSPNTTVNYGYGSNCTTLTANATGGTAPISLSWNNNATGGSTQACPTTDATYTVTATDGAGCLVQKTITVTVNDVRCGSGGVKVCLAGREICIAQYLVPTYLRLGAKLGSCGNPSARVGVEEQTELPLQLTLKAYPNPVQDAMTVEVLNRLAGSATFEVLDVTGRARQSRKENLVEGINEVGFKLGTLPTGIYLIKAVDALGQQATVRVSKQ